MSLSTSRGRAPNTRTRAGWIVCCASVLILVSPIGCSGDAGRRVLLIGIDGASPRVTREWIERGLLPNLARLAHGGASGELRSRKPMVSPRVWTSMATGMLPFKHGISGWVRKEEDGTPRLLTGADRTVPALWTIASSAGLSIGTVNWLNTHPPEKIHGVMISDFAIPGERKARFKLAQGLAKQAFDRDLAVDEPAELASAVTYPLEWVRTVREISESGSPLLDTPNPFLENQLLPNPFNHQMLARTFRTDDLIVRLSLELNEQVKPDIMMVLLQGIDRVSHFYWGALEPDNEYPPQLRFSKEGKQAALEVMRSYYQYTDRLIGSLIDRYGPKDLVLVVSDHGFEVSTDLGNGMTGGHDTDKALFGVIFGRGPGLEPGSEFDDMSVNDITPTILAWLGLPVARDMHGRPAAFIRKITQVPTYQTLEVERIGEIPEGVEDSILEDLRALGYVE